MKEIEKGKEKSFTQLRQLWPHKVRPSTAFAKSQKTSTLFLFSLGETTLRETTLRETAGRAF